MRGITHQLVFYPNSLEDTQSSTRHDVGQAGRRYLPCPNKGRHHRLLQALANTTLSKGRGYVTSPIRVPRERSRETYIGKMCPIKNPTRFCTKFFIFSWEAQALNVPGGCGPSRPAPPGRPGDRTVTSAAAAVRTMPRASVDVHRAAGLTCVHRTSRRARAG